MRVRLIVRPFDRIVIDDSAKEMRKDEHDDPDNLVFDVIRSCMDQHVDPEDRAEDSDQEEEGGYEYEESDESTDESRHGSHVRDNKKSLSQTHKTAIH